MVRANTAKTPTGSNGSRRDDGTFKFKFDASATNEIHADTSGDESRDMSYGYNMVSCN